MLVYLICSFAGWGTNEDLIISILGHRTDAQRKHIRETYAEIYGEDLLSALDKELSNDFEVISFIFLCLIRSQIYIFTRLK